MSGNREAVREDEEEFNDDPYVQRVSQLDAEELDDELCGLFKEQLTKSFKYVKPRYLSAVEIELECLLKFLLLWFSLNNHNATVGQRMLNIKFRDRRTAKVPTQAQLIVYIGGLIGIHWIKARENHVTLWLKLWPNLRQTVLSALKWSEIGIRCITLSNLLLFLVEGKYSAPLERILKLRPVPASKQNIRQVSYEYLNRELLWHGFAEFVAFFVPLMNVKRLVNAVCRYIPLEFVEPTSESQRTNEDFKLCVICQNPPTLPYCIGCRHMFCYYCINTSVFNDPNYRCPECGVQVKVHSSPRPVKV
ncbi:peroxisome assembly protein (Peroxin-2) [Chamberlinius hualienensis]